ncbi:ATP-binding protein [Gilvimarinus polysaccharolyticus]|uniref:ATP-binding protein n=1 Tax=Gilvimarinus polysaccharolyticus TaxID=863921 RepID=UPI0006731CE0|nr:ATP-binding protein [Gilvimarinus polysaccharolyticus]
MKLRRQLALVSLIALLLPWALGQYLQVFDRLLREGQVRALNATALAVAARLGADATLLNAAQLSNRASLDSEREIYAHPLASPPIIDGYTDDWGIYGLTSRQFTAAALDQQTSSTLSNHSTANHEPHNNFSLHLTAGTHGESLFLLVEVEGTKRHYHQPDSNNLASGNHLIIANQQKGMGNRYYAIRADTPGRVQAVYRDDHGKIRPDYRIRGFWRDTDAGYQVELRMPLDMAEPHFALSAIANDGNATPSAIGTAGQWASVAGGPDAGVLPGTEGRLIRQNHELSEALKVFALPGKRFIVTDRQGWQVAQAGQLESLAPQRSWVTQWLLDFAGRRRTLAPWQPVHNGRPLLPEINHHNVSDAAKSTNIDNSSLWYRAGNDDIASVAVPLYLDWPDAGAVESQLAGTVMVEQRLQPWQGLGHATLGHLAWVSALSGALLILVLIGYASWLSARIRRLSRAANAAQAQPLGEVLELWPHYRLNDELADLASQYRTLLTQVHGHTDYLKSLTGKLSHELRTPLAIVRSSLDNMDGANNSQLPVYLKRARLGSERLSAIITAMSEADRVEASIRASEPQPIDLGQLLSEMTEAYRSAYPTHQFNHTIAPAAADAYRTLAVPELLVQLLDKLVDNATDFSPPETPIELHLELSQDAEWGPSYRLSVNNTGPELPASLEGQLFNSLTSSRHSSINSSNHGRVHLGLGLYIVELIARSHQGRARAQNTPTGVCFLIELPARSPGMFAQRQPN